MSIRFNNVNKIEVNTCSDFDDRSPNAYKNLIKSRSVWVGVKKQIGKESGKSYINLVEYKFVSGWSSLETHGVEGLAQKKLQQPPEVLIDARSSEEAPTEQYEWEVVRKVWWCFKNRIQNFLRLWVPRVDCLWRLSTPEGAREFLRGGSVATIFCSHSLLPSVLPIQLHSSIGSRVSAPGCAVKWCIWRANGSGVERAATAGKLRVFVSWGDGKLGMYWAARRNQWTQKYLPTTTWVRKGKALK